MLAGEGEGVVGGLGGGGVERRRRGRGGDGGAPWGRSVRGLGTRGLDHAGQAVLEAAARAVQTEAEGAEGAAQGPAGPPRRGPLLPDVGQPAATWTLLLREVPGLRVSDVQEVAPRPERTDPEGAEGAARDVPAAPRRAPLLRGAVHEQTAAAVEAVPRGVEAAAQLRLVLGVVEGRVQLLEAVRELAAVRVPAEAAGGVAAAQLRFVPGGANHGGGGGGGGRGDQGEQSLRQRETPSPAGAGRVQQALQQPLILTGRRARGVGADLGGRGQAPDFYLTPSKHTFPTPTRISRHTWNMTVVKSSLREGGESSSAAAGRPACSYEGVTSLQTK